MSVDLLEVISISEADLSEISLRDSVPWAGGLLRVASASSGYGHSLLSETYRLAGTEELWPNARSLFDSLRKLRNELKFESPAEQTVEVAEFVCKLAHNAAGITPGFDRNCREQMISAACRMAVSLNEPRNGPIATAVRKILKKKETTC